MNANQLTSKQMRIVSITGGKGGIGKTTISINLAVAFAKMKKKVLLFDADLGLANVDVLLGLRPDKNINDVISGKCQLRDICLTGPYGLKIIPSSSGTQKLADLSTEEYAEIIRSFSSLEDEFDMMIIDMASGISKQVIDFTQATQEILVVICNDPASLMDSYAVIKILHQKYARNKFGIIVNKVKNNGEGVEVFSNFQSAAAKFINVSMHYVGCVPQDDYFILSARERVSIVEKYPLSRAVKALNEICHGIHHLDTDQNVSGGVQFFFERLIQPC